MIINKKKHDKEWIENILIVVSMGFIIYVFLKAFCQIDIDDTEL